MTMDTALIHNMENLDDFIGHNVMEHPLALQLGGNNPLTLGEAAYICESYAQFEEINLNCGCPSTKAKRAGFGAELMLEPDLVQNILHEMKRRVTHTDITVKCRLGVTKRESWEDLVDFVRMVHDCGITRMIIHARSCVLNGLSPAQNRTIPPLNYEWVHRLTEVFPEMTFVLNGGITKFSEVIEHLGDNFVPGAAYLSCDEDSSPTAHIPFTQSPSLSDPVCWDSSSMVDCVKLYDVSANTVGPTNPSPLSSSAAGTVTMRGGCEWERGLGAHGGGSEAGARGIGKGVHGVMIGREAYRNPFSFATADSTFFGSRDTGGTRREVVQAYLDYAEAAQAAGTYGSNTCNIIKPLHNVFAGAPDGSNALYKRKLDAILKRDAKSGCGLEEMVVEAMDGTIPPTFLDTDILVPWEGGSGF